MRARFGKLAAVGELSARHGRIACALVAGALAAGGQSTACAPTALETVDLGDKIEAPELRLDEQFFHCEIQPKVLTQYGCAAGGPGDSGGCHAARSALRLVEAPMPPICQGGHVIGAPSPESLVNLERVRADIGVDADSSPLYRRPTGLDSHPREIFASDSEAAALLRSWLNGGGSP